MSRNLYEPTIWTAVATNRYKIKDTRQKPLASQWIVPYNQGDDPPETAPDYTPELENDWIQVENPLQEYAFRLHYDGSLEFRGHLDASGGAVSGTVAVTLPGEIGEPNYRLDEDQFWHTVITDDAGTSFQIALVFIDSSNGEVTITWPAT